MNFSEKRKLIETISKVVKTENVKIKTLKKAGRDLVVIGIHLNYWSVDRPELTFALRDLGFSYVSAKLSGLSHMEVTYGSKKALKNNK